MFEEHKDYGVEHFEVVEAAGVGHGVVGHKEPEENEENLTPDERRRRALDRAMDAALKNPNKRRRKKDEVVR